MDAEAFERKPNTYLKYEREQRGWTQNDMANHLSELCSDEELAEHGFIDGKRVSRWELGKHRPDPFWRKKLSELFGKSPEKLGLIEAPQEQVPSRNSATTATTLLVSPSIQVIIPNALIHTGDTLPTLAPPTIISISPQTQVIDAILAARGGLPGAVLPQPGIDNASFSTYAQNEREQQLSIHLLLGAGHIAPLLDEGWSPEDVLHLTSSFAKVVQAMPNISRQQFLRTLAGTAVAAFVGNIPNYSTEKHVTEENRAQLHQALSDSIVSGWKSFHTASNAQVLTLAQAQLYLVQQNHSLLYPQVRSMFYTSTQNLIGRTLHLQERYQEALDAHINAHIAAMSSGDPVYVVQSLICQADTYQALGHHSKAVETVEEALCIMNFSTISSEHYRLKAHLLACWADSAMQMRNHAIAQRKLEEAAMDLDYISSNEEFDKASWLQLAGKNALMAGDPTTAIRYFEDALSELPPNWVVRITGVLVPLAMAYARIRERDASLNTAKKAIPVLSTMSAPMSNKHFAEYIQNDLRTLSSHDAIIQGFVQDVTYHLPQVAALIG